MISRETIEQLENFEFNPMNDVAFKFIFGSNERKHITLAFLNAVLKPSLNRTITDLEFVPVETSPAIGIIEETRLDISCKLENKEAVDVEVQIANLGTMHQRTIFYWTQLYQKSFSSCWKSQDRKPAIIIKILGNRVFPERNDAPYYDVYSICSLETGRCLNNDMELHFLDIPKYRDYRLQEKISVSEMTKIERWMAYFANNLDTQEKEELAIADEAISSAMEESRIYLDDTTAYLKYVNCQRAVCDYNSEMTCVYEKGRQEGIKEQLVVRMLVHDESIDQIMKWTSFSLEKIKEIAKENFINWRQIENTTSKKNLRES